MNTIVVQAPLAVSAPDIAGLEPLRPADRRWPVVLAGLLTVAMILGLAHELAGAGLAGFDRALPRDPRFYLIFVALYMSPVMGDFIIFRRLWDVPASALIALVKKRIANDVVVSYSGEAYFYAWARAHARVVAAPFGAVKDVSILSAIAGNAVTLAMVAVALPFGRSLLSLHQYHLAMASASIVLATSLPFLIFSHRVFSLPRPELRWIFGIHCLRLVIGSLLIAMAWHVALPQVSLGVWLCLAAGRLLVSRLPLVPNKDLLFANFAILLIGQGHALSDLIAFSAALTLVIHGVLIAVFAIQALIARLRPGLGG